MRFDIQPWQGALPITFGMQRTEVQRVIGAPEWSRPVWDKNGVAEGYLQGGFNVGYNNDMVVNHLGFRPGRIELLFKGELLWAVGNQPDPNRIFLTADPAPFESVGFWIFSQIGVTTTGYHDDDPSQQAVTVFSRNRLAAALSRVKPADTQRYHQS